MKLWKVFVRYWVKIVTVPLCSVVCSKHTDAACDRDEVYRRVFGSEVSPVMISTQNLHYTTCSLLLLVLYPPIGGY